MKLFVKSYWKIILFFTLVGLVGGYFTGQYALSPTRPRCSSNCWIRA